MQSMEREEALKLLKDNLSNENLIKHCLAVEAIMRGVAKAIGKDEEKFALTGLLHDIDYEKTANEHEKHALVAEEILKGRVNEEIIKAIKAHNFENTKIIPETKMEIALIASDAISGLLIACALVMPSKKLEEVKVSTVRKKFRQKDFARSCSRERIKMCEKIGIELESFFEISLNALKSISNELGL